MTIHHPPIFRPPQLHMGDGENHRRVTWMELFFDLVYVATLVQLGNYLSDNVTLQGALTFTALFIPVWWSWVGTTFYANRFDSDDVLHRVLVFVQIAGVYLMAINLREGLGENTARFALSYTFVRLVLVVMYFRAARAIPLARPLATRYGTGFAVAAAIWAFSALVPAPWRYGVWVVALLIDFGTPLSQIRLQRQLPPSSSHLPERFGLFTIIVLGEGFLKVVGGMAGEVLTLQQIILDVPGLIIAGSLWWIYFDNVAEVRFRVTRPWAQAWLYAHLPLHLALTMLGVGLYKLVTNEDSALLPYYYRWLICGSTALGLLMVAIVERSVLDVWTRVAHREFGLRLAGVAACLLLAVVGDLLTGTTVMILLGLIGVIQVGVDLLWRWQALRAAPPHAETQEQSAA